MNSTNLLWLAAVAFALGCGACAQQVTPRPAMEVPNAPAVAHEKLVPMAVPMDDLVLLSADADVSAPSRGRALDAKSTSFYSLDISGGAHGATLDWGLMDGPALAFKMEKSDASKLVPLAGKPQPDVKPNTLTAGSFDDNNSWAPYTRFVNEQVDKKGAGADFMKQFTGRRAWVKVVDMAGKPIEDALVTVVGSDPPVSVKTRADGRALFLETWDHVGGPVAALSIAVPSLDQPVAALAAFDTPNPVTVPIDSIYDGGRLPNKLDLMFVVDCTGSMSDELAYLKVEVQSIAEAVKQQFPRVGLRFGLICYRDVKDEYVVRKFDFTDSLADFSKNLDAQQADGGGDEPEAMEQALAAAGDCDWSVSDTARLAFLIADAPPHTPDMPAGMKALNVLRSKGVGIYPVACSGASPDCEFIMRTAAVSSLGTYLFATDHSGVGNAHAQPHFPFYRVEKLAPLMERMIAGELSGHVVEPAPEQIIATVETPRETSARVEKNVSVP